MITSLRIRYSILEFTRGKTGAPLKSPFKSPEVHESGVECNLSYGMILVLHEQNSIGDSHAHQPVPETNANLLMEEG